MISTDGARVTEGSSGGHDYSGPSHNAPSGLEKVVNNFGKGRTTTVRHALTSSEERGWLREKNLWILSAQSGDVYLKGW